MASKSLITADHIAEARRLRLDGTPWVDVADWLEVNSSSIRNAVKRAITREARATQAEWEAEFEARKAAVLSRVLPWLTSADANEVLAASREIRGWIELEMKARRGAYTDPQQMPSQVPDTAILQMVIVESRGGGEGGNES